MTRSLLIFMLLVLTSFSLKAQINIYGKVAEGTGKTGMGYINISLLTYHDSARVRTTLTDSVGLFQLTGIKNGRYILQVSAMGYKTVAREVVVEEKQGDLHVGELLMLQDGTLLNEVVVKGEKAAIRYQSDKVILNVSGNSFFKTATNAIDIIRKAPGITETADGNLLMSGQNTPVIFVDGKPVNMSAEELRAYLSGLPQESIESIELISNPSSRYDAQYKGIIDIKLKKDRQPGWRGNLSSSFRQNDYGYIDNNLNLTLKTRRVGYSVRLGYVRGTDLHLYQALQHQANTNIMATRTRTTTFNNNFNIQAGADVSIAGNQNLEISVKSFVANRDLNAWNTLTFTDSSDTKLLGINGSNNIAAPAIRNNTLSVGYDIRLGNNRLNVLANITNANNKRNEDIQNRDRITNDLISYWKTALDNDVQIRNIQADFTRNMSGGTLEAGAKFAMVSTDNDLKYDTLTKDDRFVPDAGRTNRFEYNEYVTAGYISYDRKFKKFNVKLSLRTEYTHTVADAITTNEIRKRDYVTWLPGAAVNYTINTNERINFSFTRRMTRPGFDQLNPFRFYLSPLNYWVGNPYLRPSVTSVINLSYSYKDFNVALNVGRENDYMTRYPEYNRVTNELLYLGTNLPYNNFAYLEAGYTFPVKQWWKTVHNASVNYNKQLMPYFDKNFEIGVVDFSINGSQVFTLPRGFLLDLSYRYKSKSGNSLYYIKQAWSVDMGLQKSWLQGKLNTKLNFYDMFASYAVQLTFREKSIIDNQLSHRFGTQRGVITVNWNFGRSTYKGKQQKNSEEESRLNN